MSHTQIQRLAAAAFGVALAFAVGTPTVARAVTAAELQAQYEEASNHLSTLSADVAEADAQLSETRSKMDEANASIDRLSEELGEKQAQLVEARNMLSKRVRASYKSGGVSFLGMLLQADSFEELVSTVYYADKISERDAKSIDAVDTAYAELKGKKDELEDLQTTYDSLYEQQEAELQELEQRRQEGQDYVNGLSAELRQKLEAERQEELARLREQEEQQEQEQAAPQQEEQQETPAPAEEQQPPQQEQQTPTQEQTQTQEQKPATPSTNNNSNNNTNNSELIHSAGSGPWDNYASPLSDVRSPDYDAWRHRWIMNNLNTGMSTMQKVQAVVNFVSSFPYDRAKRHYTGIAMYQYGNGTCGSSAEMVKAFCDDLGIGCAIRDASGDVGNVHFNDFVWIDGVRYIVDANPGSNGGIRPRRG